MVTFAHNLWLELYLGFRARFAWSSPSSYLVNAVIRPMLTVMLFGFLGRFAVDPDLAKLIVVGISVNAAGVFLAGTVTTAFNWEKWSGTLSAIFVSSGSRFVHYFSRGLSHYPNGFVTIAMGLLGGLIFLGVDYSATNWGPFLLAAFLIVTSVLMFVLLLGNLAVFLQDWQNLYSIALGIFLTMTGIVIPLTSMPLVLERIAQVMPITHGFLALKAALTGASFASVQGELLRELLVALGYAVIGYVSFRLVEREVKLRGTLEREPA